MGTSESAIFVCDKWLPHDSPSVELAKDTGAKTAGPVHNYKVVSTIPPILM